MVQFFELPGDSRFEGREATRSPFVQVNHP